MLAIYTQNKFIPEKEYIFDVLFNEFLGFDYKLKLHNKETYKVVIGNGNFLEFADNFFSENNEKDGYLSTNNLPEDIRFLKNRKFLNEEDLPIIYGTDLLEIKDGNVILGQDIFASSFFMLTRWEEKVKLKRDKYDRFPDENAYVQIQGVEHRPLVNEYLFFLLNLLKHIGFSEKEKSHNYKPIITHDVDFLARYDKISKFVKALGGDILKRKSLKSFVRTIKDYYNIKILGKLDNYDVFDFLMKVSEDNSLLSNFYFIPTYVNEEDARYDIRDIRIKKKIENIKKRGHNIGLHGAYRSFKTPKLFKEELERLKKIHNNITKGREHYLRFSNPETWQIWEDNSLLEDSTMGFSYGGGFRAGTCFEYPVFNIESRKKLNLRESPLIAMEVAIIAKYPDKDKYFENIISLSNTVRKYKGNFVFLWHNSNFNTFEWDFGIEYYKKIIKEISN